MLPTFSRCDPVTACMHTSRFLGAFESSGVGAFQSGAKGGVTQRWSFGRAGDH